MRIDPVATGGCGGIRRRRAGQVVCGMGPIVLGQRDVAHVSARELRDPLRDGERGEDLAGINLVGRRDRLDSRGVADVGADAVELRVIGSVQR